MHRSSVVRRLAAALALAALAISIAAPATLGAAKKKTHKISATVTASAVATSNGVTTVAGVVKGKPLSGEGAIVYRITSAPTGTQTAKFTAFDKRGSLTGRSTVNVAAGPNNTTTVSGTGKLTRGTGAYKGATGKITVSGTIDANGVIHLTATGSVKY